MCFSLHGTFGNTICSAGMVFTRKSYCMREEEKSVKNHLVAYGYNIGSLGAHFSAFLRLLREEENLHT